MQCAPTADVRSHCWLARWDFSGDPRPAGAPAPDQFFLSGGAAGRWVFHCHLFLHAAVGMVSELVVVDTDRDGDGFDTSVDCDDIDPQINPAAE